MKNVTRDMIGREEEMHNINMDRQNVRTIGLQFSKLPGTKHKGYLVNILMFLGKFRNCLQNSPTITLVY